MGADRAGGAGGADGASGACGAGGSGVQVHVVYAGAPKDLLGIFLAPLEPNPCPYSYSKVFL